MNDIHFPGTRNPDNFNACRITQPHRTCQVRSGISSEIAAKRDDNRLKILTHNTPSSKASTLLSS
jgi:hypothetical protein